MTYQVVFTDIAQSHLKMLQRDEPSAYKKALRLIAELYEHPLMGTGHPEPLKGKPEGRWSRQLTKKHRLVYRVVNDEVLVLVLAAYGHYGDK